VPEIYYILLFVTSNVTMIPLGDLQLHLINDADTRVDPGGAFGLVPRVLWSRYLQPDDEQLVLMRNHCLYFELAGKKILIDTGMGTRLDERGRERWRLARPHGDVIAALARLGVQPSDIDLVINTHLHSDHCSGNLILDEAGNIQPTFPNAEYVVQRREYEDAMHPNERTAATYFPENYEPLVASGQMRLLDGDTELAAGLTGCVTPGHTPGHMSIAIESAGEYALFTCDMATYAIHFERLGWMTAYDVEPLVTLETKRRWQTWALERRALLIFPHDPVRPVGRTSTNAAGKFAVEPIDVEYA
jgi:glyoxylase-like metal-dependent hydrolase (beta-lactamase superfamily II)